MKLFDVYWNWVDGGVEDQVLEPGSAPLTRLQRRRAFGVEPGGGGSQ